MKKIFVFSLLSFATFLLVLFMPPAVQAQGQCSSDADCTGEEKCLPFDPNESNSPLFCTVPQLGNGSDCNVSEDRCLGNMACIPNSPGDQSGKCGTVREGSLCDPTRSESCGPSVTTPWACLPATSGGHTCQSVSCDPAKNNSDCFAVFKKPTHLCVPGTGGAFCKFVDVTNWQINVKIVTKDDFKVPEDITLDFKQSVELKQNNTSVNTIALNKRLIFKKGETYKFSEGVEFGDVKPGKYDVCFPAAIQCKQVEKNTTGDAEVTIEVTPCDLGISTTDTDCGPPPGPPPPCPEGKFQDGKCTVFNTAFGDFSTDPAGFIRSVFGILLAASGAIAILLIIRAGYKIMNSQGKPEPLQEGRDQLVAAIVGLIFLIFSFVFLELIGVNLLRIPGFTEAGSIPKGAQCDASSGNQCAPGLTCVSQGGTKGGICKDLSGNPPNQAGLEACKSETISLGSNGNCVVELQHALGLVADGVFGPQTEEAAKQYQNNKGLVTDGVVGPCTWDALIGNTIPQSCKR